MSAWVVGLAVMQVAVLGLSLLEVAISQAVAVGILAASVLAGGAEYLRLRPAPAQRLPRPCASRWPIFLVIVATGVFISLTAVACLKPDWSWDGNAYHIPTINQWARRGYVCWVDPAFRFGAEMNGYPNAAEVVSLVLVRALGTSAVVNASTLLFLPLGVAGIAYLAREMGAPGEVALSAGAAFLLVPVNLYQTVSTYVDTSYACCVIALVAGVVMVGTKLFSSSRLPWSVLVTLGCAAGLTIGVKGSEAVLVAIALVLLAASAARRLQLMPRGRRAGSAGKAAAFLAVAGCITLAVGGYWYARNWWQTDSLFYPVGISVAGLRIFPGKSVGEAIFAWENTPEFMRSWSPLRKVACTWCQGLWNWPRTVFGFDARRGGLGYLWLLGCVPAMLFLLWRFIRGPGWRRMRPGSVLAAATVGAGFFLTPMNWWARYTVWVYAVGLPCLAVVAGEVLAGGRRGRLLRVWLAACTLVLLSEACLCLTQMKSDTNGGRFVTAAADEADRSSRKKRMWYPLTDLGGSMFDEMVTGREPVAIGHLPGRQAVVIGPLSLPVGRRDVVALPGRWQASGLEKIKSAGVRYVVWDGQRPLPPALRALAVRSERAAGLRLLDLGPQR